MAANAESWIEWGGGECPIPPGSKFQYRLRDGTTGAPLTTASAWEWHHYNSPYDIIAYRFGPASSDAEGEWVKTETLDRLQQELAYLRSDRDNSNSLLDECRHERNVLQRICAERAHKIERLRDALAAVRVKALPAGASIMRQSERWEGRCREVLDIIDTALDERNAV